MRNKFFSQLASLMAADDRVVFLTGDLGFKLYDACCQVDPARVINFGIREAAMVGFAAGLAKIGMRPLVYSIVPFVTLRCLEQIKIDLCYNQCPVVLVGVGGGLTYGINGPTHHGVDDVAVLSALTGLRIWTPCDGAEVGAMLELAPGLKGPAYLRLGRGGEPLYHAQAPSPDQVERPVVEGDPARGAIISYGHIWHEVRQAAKLIQEQGLRPALIHLPRLRPFPAQELLELLPRRVPVMCVEEQVPCGGLGQQLASLLLGAGHQGPFAGLCLEQGSPEVCLDRAAGLAWAGLDPKAIAQSFVALAASRHE